MVGGGKSARTVLLVSTPILYGDRFLGMIGCVVDLQFLIRRLQEVNRAGLIPYVVDSQGRLVAAASRRIRDRPGHDQFRHRPQFCRRWRQGAIGRNPRIRHPRRAKNKIEMLGTYSPVSCARLGGGRTESRATKPTAASTKCSAPDAFWPCWPFSSASA